MTTFKIGFVKGKEPVQIDLNSLLRTRVLIQANSGGGKSYLIRKILEETHGKVQHIVLDLEGEFSTLREKFDYLLVGVGGDIPIDVKSAELLAKKLLALQVSTIVDLYELKKHERILFVKLFLDSMMNAKKELWHPVLVIVDEAHVLCPEGKSGKAESTGSVIDLMTRGRKRGYCGVLATQRLSKLNKDASAEANNKLIGRTGLDIDMKRAGDELGFNSKEQFLSLRSLDPGNFFAFGTAISKKIIKIKIGKVKTTHPEAGVGKLTAPSPPTPKIKRLLKKLVDLPKKAEQELMEKEDFKAKIRELKIKLRKASANIEINDSQKEKFLKQGFREAELAFKTELNELNKSNFALKSAIDKAINIFNKVPELKKIKKFKSNSNLTNLEKFVPKEAVFKIKTDKNIPVKTTTTQVFAMDSELKLQRNEKAILSLLFNNPHKPFEIKMVALFTGYSPKSGGFKNSISHLNSMGIIRRIGTAIEITQEGLSQATDLLGSDIDMHEEFTIQGWINKLPKCESLIFKFLLENPGQEFLKEDLAVEVNYSLNSGGFKNALSRLNSLGLIIRGSGTIKLNEKILEDYQ